MTAVQTGIAVPHPIYLAGRWVESPDVLVVDNPARPGEPAGATYLATAAQYEEAVEAAVRAFEATRKLPAFERGRALRDISDGIKARREELGALIALEAGKPIRDALVEVDRATLTFRLGAEEAERMVGETIPLDINPASRDRVGITRRFPIGPIAGDQPVQLPAQPRGPQARAGDRLGQPDRAQAAVQGPAGHAQGRGDHRGGRPARGRGEHPADEPRAGRPDGRGRAVQAAQLHRVAVGRLADEGRGPARRRSCSSWAATPASSSTSRRTSTGPSGARCRRVRLQRPGLHQRAAAVRARGRLGRLHAPVRRGGAQPPPGRPVRRIDGRRADGRRGERRPDRGLGRRRRSRPAPRCWLGGTRDGTFFAPTILANVPRTAKVCTQEAFAPIVVAERFSSLPEAIASVNDSDVRAAGRRVHLGPRARRGRASTSSRSAA